MKIGFIGAGKVGFSLGKHLKLCGKAVSGYYSRHWPSAQDAAAFTETKAFDTMKHLVEVSDVLFLTVPDMSIGQVWKSLRSLDLQGKAICHCSGAMVSSVFSDAGRLGASGYSVHPFLAVSDKYTSYKALAHALFTVEGDPAGLNGITELLTSCGNRVQQIAPAAKTRYHLAASIASNFMVTLYDVAEEILLESGFRRENLPYALPSLVRGNIENVIEKGAENALTGPIERGDAATVEKHLAAVPEKERALYRVLAERTLELAKRKNPERSYADTEQVLQECTGTAAPRQRRVSHGAGFPEGGKLSNETHCPDIAETEGRREQDHDADGLRLLHGTAGE